MPLKFVRYRDYGGKEKVSSVEELLAEGRANPYFPVPYPILKSMLDSSHKKLEMPDGKPAVGVTSLLKGCLRCAILERETDYIESLDAMWSRWRGSMYHTVIELNKEEGAIVEHRFVAPISDLGWVQCIADIILPSHATLIDLKTTASVPKWDRVWDDHRLQLNFNRYVVNHAEFDVDSEGNLQQSENYFVAKKVKFTSVGIWYADDKGVKPLEVRQSFNVPTISKDAKNPLKKIKKPEVLTDEQVEKLLVPRLKESIEAMQHYENTGELPPYPKEIVDPLPGAFWPHRYSPVSYLCLKDHFKRKEET